MEIYERIETLRKEYGFSQGKLEKELGFSNGSISKWKNSMPTSERLKKLADYFNVSVEYLMTGEEKEINETYCQNDNTIRPLPRIMEYYNQLNDLGKSEATKRVEELTYFPNYTSSNETDTQDISFKISDVPDTFEEKLKMINSSIGSDVG